MRSPVLLALGAPVVEGLDDAPDVGVCSVELRADGTLAVLLEGDEESAMIVFPARAVSADLLAWQQARQVRPEAAA